MVKRNNKKIEVVNEVNNDHESDNGEVERTEYDAEVVNEKKIIDKTTNDLINNDGSLAKRKVKTLSEKQVENLRNGRAKRLERIRQTQKERQDHIASMVEQVAEKKIKKTIEERQQKRQYDEDKRIVNRLKKLIDDDGVEDEDILNDKEEEEADIIITKRKQTLEEAKQQEIIQQPYISHPRLSRRDPLLRHRMMK